MSSRNALNIIYETRLCFMLKFFFFFVAAQSGSEMIQNPRIDNG